MSIYHTQASKIIENYKNNEDINEELGRLLENRGFRVQMANDIGTPKFSFWVKFNDFLLKAYEGEEYESEESEELPKKKTEPELDYVIYSDKSIAVVGEGTREIKDKLMDMKGIFNRGLKIEGETKAGFIFAMTREREVSKFMKMKPRKMK